ncbi:MAG TPA: VWA domain-containing protein, partial [Lysobacter sp.]|nr:VWA domain-containing protein [Lysobacter sp.]
HGASAFSESETGNIRWLLEEFPNILVGVDAHSYGQQILRPGPAGGSFIASLPVSPEDHAIYNGLETTLHDAIASVNGVSYSTGSTSNHAGTSDEYMFFAHRVFGFNTECGTSFQPPWADAVSVINEVVTGLRALAVATLDLTLTTPAPLQIVQCIDRTGSMISFGYDSSARTNAKRFVDLLSLGDTTGIVTFADPAADPLATPVANRSHVEFPLTLLDDPGDAAVARSAIDGIVFGGWTPIGAGLQRSATMLASAASPKAILLISDGYENRDPSVATALASWPADLRVFTIALGPAADTVLLQQIATQTGGIFQASPTSLDLHLIYNQMRADMTDEGLVLNRAVPASQEDGAHNAYVEPAADWLTVTVSTMERHPPRISLLSPSGRSVSPHDFGVRMTLGEGYAVIRIARPAPGKWRIYTGKQSSACVVAAFVTSPLRTRIQLPHRLKPKAEIMAKVHASFGDRPLAPVRARLFSGVVPNMILPKELQRDGASGWSDSLPRDALASMGARAKSGVVSISRAERAVASPGLSRVEIEIDGQLPGGAHFRRVALRTIRTADAPATEATGTKAKRQAELTH